MFGKPAGITPTVFNDSLSPRLATNTSAMSAANIGPRREMVWFASTEGLASRNRATDQKRKVTRNSSAQAPKSRRKNG